MAAFNLDRGHLRELIYLTGFLVAASVHGFSVSHQSCPLRPTGSCCGDSFISTSTSICAGPKSEGRRRQRRSGGANREMSQRTRRRPTKDVLPSFDGKALTAAQLSNEESSNALDLQAALLDNEPSLRCMSDDYTRLQHGQDISQQSALRFYSLENLFGEEFSETFHSNEAFRNDLRSAIRQDVFDTTPAYANLSEKASTVLLLPDSSLQGSWRKPLDMYSDTVRMKATTALLQKVFGNSFALTGDDLMLKIGSLCGSEPSTHWIDIVGVQDRAISHSFHQDTGLSPQGDTKTVLWGFPREDNYKGTGVFSHIVTLQNECFAPQGHPRMEPVLFDGKVPKDCVIRPEFAKDKELLVYRDVDVIRSSPDVAYRTSLMRFM